MKKLSYLFISFTLLLFACQNTETKKQKPFVLKGSLVQGSDPAVLLLKSFTSLDTIEVNEAGYFETTIELNNPRFFNLYYGRNALGIFAQSGDTLTLFSLGETFGDSVQFSGSLTKENLFIKQFFTDMRNSRNNRFYKLSLDSFLQKVDSVYQLKSEYFINAGSEEMNKDFVNLFKVKISADHDVFLVNYPRYHQFYAELDSLPVMPENYYQFIDNYDFNKLELYSISEFSRLSHAVIDQRAEQIMKDSALDENNLADMTYSDLLAIDAFIGNPEIKDQLMYASLSDHVKYYGIAHLDKVLDFYDQVNTNPQNKTKIEEALKQWEHLKTGLPAPQFTAINLEGNEYKLSDFLGKYVYIDVWATWCGPCRYEIPFLEKLHEALEGKNIQLMSISADRDSSAWAAMVTEQEMKGMQLFLPENWDSELTVQYNIHSIPRFILIDREGKLIDVNAPRPSGNIQEIIEALPGI